MQKQIAAIYDDFNGGKSTIIYDDGSQEISTPEGTTYVPAPKPQTGAGDRPI